MATLDVLTIDNAKAGTVDLASSVFETTVKPHLFHAEVRRQLAGRRAGTHSTRNRSLVSGGGAKPWRQKGTGRARQGSTRSPQWKGGGVVFGPVPRSYDHKLPKKVRQAALRGALSQKLAEQAITVIEDFAFDEYKTKRALQILQGLGLAAKSVLIVVAEESAPAAASVRNLPGVGFVRAEGLNVYDVLRHDALLLTRPALEQIEARLARAERAGEA